VSTNDRELLLYSLTRAADTAVDVSRRTAIGALLERVDAGEIPDDSDVRAAAAAAAVALQDAADRLPALIARLQTLAQKPTKELGI
jgi:phytoene/squalene synthetase